MLDPDGVADEVPLGSCDSVDDAVADRVNVPLCVADTEGLEEPLRVLDCDPELVCEDVRVVLRVASLERVGDCDPVPVLLPVDVTEGVRVPDEVTA